MVRRPVVRSRVMWILMALLPSYALAAETVQNGQPPYMSVLNALVAYPGVVPKSESARNLGGGKFRYEVTGIDDEPGTVWFKWDETGLRILGKHLGPQTMAAYEHLVAKMRQEQAAKTALQYKHRLKNPEMYREHRRREYKKKAAFFNAKNTARRQANQGRDRFPFLVRIPELGVGFLPFGYEFHKIPTSELVSVLEQARNTFQLRNLDLLSIFHAARSSAQKAEEFFVVFRERPFPGAHAKRGIVQFDAKGMQKGYIRGNFFVREDVKKGKRKASQ